MQEKIRDEYYFLTDKLDEIIWALNGECDDIDCDKYMYKDLLKKKYKPVLEHNFSCIEKLTRDKETVMNILSNKKYKRYRYEKCAICKKLLDKLNDKSKIVSFTKQSPSNKEYHQWKGIWAHKNCSYKVKVPKGWKKF